MHYEHILRAIGQGLEALSIEAFDLEVANDTFLIQGTVKQKQSAKRRTANLIAFKKAFLDICHISKKPPSSKIPARKVAAPSRSLCLQFTRNDIDKLERDGQASRSDWNTSPLAHSLPQLLRTVGWYVDQKERWLHKISNNGESVTISYLEPIGAKKIETFTLLQLYDMWVHLYKRRKGYIQIGPEILLSRCIWG